GGGGGGGGAGAPRALGLAWGEGGARARAKKAGARPPRACRGVSCRYTTSSASPGCATYSFVLAALMVSYPQARVRANEKHSLGRLDAEKRYSYSYLCRPVRAKAKPAAARGPGSMSDAATTPLHTRERRILGVLVEKAKTTPDIYPLSVNALVTGCNQKSNREPMMALRDEEVEELLEGLQKRGLVSRVTGGRVERWRHHLYEVWNVNKVELAILAELLLRGAQTEGELRVRASRMEPIADVDALRAALGPMKQRGLIVYLGEEGRRGTTVTHGFLTPKELEHARATPRADPLAEANPQPPAANSAADAEATRAE